MSNNAPKSSVLRIVIPLAAVLVGLLVLLSQMASGDEPSTDGADNQTAQAPADAADASKPEVDDDTADPAPPADDTPPATADDGASDEDPAAPPPLATTEADTDEPATEEPDVPGPLDDLRALFNTDPDLIDIGSKDPASGHELFVQINPYRACIHQALLTNEFLDVDKAQQYPMLQPIDMSLDDQTYPTIGSYAAKQLTINGQAIPMAEINAEGQWIGSWQVDTQTPHSVTLSLIIQGGPADARTDVAKVTRTYSIAPGSHTVALTQYVENLTTQPLRVQWQQLAQSDVHKETNDYLRGRSLHFVTGYFNDKYDPAHFSIYVDDGFIVRPTLIDKINKGKWQSVWPNKKVDPGNKQLAWLASENRYLVAVSSAFTPPTVTDTADVTALQAVYPFIATDIYPSAGQKPDMDDNDRMVLITLTSRELQLDPGRTTKREDLSLDLFVGPREGAVFAQDPYKALRFEKTIRYSLGGPCGFCTFQWLANLLLSFLELLHAVTFDWGVSIVILVLVVRICLHPITKRGQINMMKMGKQMAAVQPEMDKLKKKYADDPRAMQAAQMQLFREKGINPAAGALGCLPMLLQMPIWIALYAMLYYAIELRHEPAFYGVFQAIGNWPFLADLSSADRFIPLFEDDGSHILNLIFIQFNYSSINILPLLMGVTFFINMKFTTPPPMNEQQATQQKIMKIMPMLFPIFLYSAPAGLTLYISASTLAGIVDSYIVRKHIKQLEESGELFKPKPRKPGGLMDKLQKAAEAKAVQIEDAKKQQQQNKGPQNYKKRKR